MSDYIDKATKFLDTWLDTLDVDLFIKQHEEINPYLVQGDLVIWSGPDYDFPGVFEEKYPEHEDGFTYARITNHLGSTSVVRYDQLTKTENMKIEVKEEPVPYVHPHKCPYKDELFNDKTLCSCNEEKTRACAMEV